MKLVPLTLATAAAVGLAASASAQTFGIGSTKAGAVSQITATISKAVSEHADGVQMRKQTMGGTQQYIPVVNAGELGFWYFKYFAVPHGPAGHWPVERSEVQQPPSCHDNDEIHREPSGFAQIRHHESFAAQRQTDCQRL